MTLKPGAPYTAIHENFVDMMHDMGLEQMVQKPTRDTNTLDLILTNSPSLIPRIECVPGVSDHDIVYFEYIVKPDTRKNAARPVLLYSRANWDQMKDDMVQPQNSYADTEVKTTEELWQMFKTTIKRSMDSNIPSKTPRRKDSLPWITAEIRKLIRKR